ncbi:MAG: carboxypeptidase regulatory-like domain-containing protein, partial [Elusimicrobia bacterium]|nr:carboxypeptidase regulatory-like domain-containing protein [Elusimicrobiota bacterium]
GDGKNVDENGGFEFPNLAPGAYRLTMEPRGAGFVWAPASLDSVSVAEGKTTEIKLQLEKGLAVKPQIYGLPEISTPTWGYSIIGVESGEEMTQKKITDLFFSEPKYSFEYSTTTGWSTMYMPSGQYDFYLLMDSKYDPGGGDEGRQSFQQFANFIGRIKGMAVQKSETNPNIGTAAQPIAINILGAVGQAQIAGTVQGSKMFTAADLERMFANFKELFPLIPAVLLYDTAGDLRGFANAMPNEAAFTGFWTALTARDAQGMRDYLKANPMDYGVWGLPPGRYTVVFANPNYPPVAKEITLPDNASYVFNFDDEQVIVGSISGVVKSSATSLELGGARVYLKHRIVEKFTLTDSSGAFSFANLPAGIYRLEVSRNGYVTAGRKTSLAGSLTGEKLPPFDIYLLPSESRLSGRLFISKFPTPVTKAGVEIVAYDESLNTGELPTGEPCERADYLPKTEVQTDASGNYEITGVVPGHLYKLSAFYRGKQPEVLEVTAQEGNTVISDITLKNTPPQITIKVRKSADSVSKVDVVIKSPKQLISIPSCQYNPGQDFDENSAVTLALVPGPGNTYLGRFTVTSGQQYYVVKVTAGDGSNKMSKEFVYDQVSNAKTEQYIQQESLAGGEVQMDKETEEYSGIELDPGALSYSTVTTGAVDYSNLVGGFFSALPSVRTVKTAKGDLSVSDAIQSLMASEVYDLDLSNASANKPFTLTLKYDKEKGSGSQGLRIYQYDDATASWKEIPGNYTVDPMLGVVSVDVAGLSRAYEGAGGANTPLGRKRFGMSAVVNGRYVPSAASTSQSGQFAVFTAFPGAGVPYAGSSFEVYNMPNPFSLKVKDVIVSEDGSGVSLAAGARPTKGTLIKYHLPAGKSGNLKFVIYNLAGEKVRTLDETHRDGGAIYYSEWDGKNDNNTDCASGVYFMLTYLNGDKLGGKAHKMAIIK